MLMFATADRPAFLRLINDVWAEEQAVREPARILVVEDEMLFAETLVGLLQDDGFSAAGPTATVAGALNIMARSRIDAAILDVRLVHELSYHVAYALKDRDIPFIFVTACRRLDLPLDLRSRPLLEKPFHPPALLQTLREVLPVSARR
jgi:DNA-binding response OmpR family regulator